VLYLIQKEAAVDKIALFKLSWLSCACAGNTDMLGMTVEHCVPF